MWICGLFLWCEGGGECDGVVSVGGRVGGDGRDRGRRRMVFGVCVRSVCGKYI